MNKHNLTEGNSSKSTQATRVKVTAKKTVGITLPQNLVKRARKHRLNISRVAEQALNSILDYLETQQPHTSSDFLSTGSFLKERVVDGAGFEPAASTMPTWRSFQADLPAHMGSLDISSVLFDVFGCEIKRGS